MPPLAVHELTSHGSLFLTRPTLADYTATREQLEANAAELFQVVADGAVQIRIGQTCDLSDAATAHRDLEARSTTGATVLLPPTDEVHPFLGRGRWALLRPPFDLLLELWEPAPG